MEPFQNLCYIKRKRIKKDSPLKSFTWDCFSVSQAAKHFNKLGKWDCKTTTSDSKPQGQEPFLKLILTHVLTLIRFHVVNVPLSCLSVLRENLVSFVDSEAIFFPAYCHHRHSRTFLSFISLQPKRCPAPDIFSSALFPYEMRHFPQKWHLTAPATKPSLKQVPMQPLKDSTH